LCYLNTLQIEKLNHAGSNPVLTTKIKIMKKLLWKLLKLVDNNWGYSTPIQQRFKIGDKCRIHFCYTENTGFISGETVTIIETGRHDYLVRNESGNQSCVYQFELSK